MCPLSMCCHTQTYFYSYSLAHLEMTLHLYWTGRDDSWKWDSWQRSLGKCIEPLWSVKIGQPEAQSLIPHLQIFWSMDYGAWAPLAVLFLVLDIPSDTALRKTDFSFPSKYQFQIVSFIGVRPCTYYAPSSSQCWDPLPELSDVWVETVQVFYVFPQSLKFHMCFSPVVPGRYGGSLESCITSGSYNISDSSST